MPAHSRHFQLAGSVGLHIGPLELKVNRMDWFAVSVKPRHEKSVSKILELKDLESLLPLYRARQRWSDRTKELELPLFPGYVFCRFDMAARVPVLNTPGVFDIVRFGREFVPVDSREIAALQQLMCSGLPSEPWPRLELGEPVVVEIGPLAGCQGVLVEIRKQMRLLLSVTLLGRSVSVEVDREWVQPAVSHKRSPEVAFPLLFNNGRYPTATQR